MARECRIPWRSSAVAGALLRKSATVLLFVQSSSAAGVRYLVHEPLDPPAASRRGVPPEIGVAYRSVVWTSAVEPSRESATASAPVGASVVARPVAGFSTAESRPSW